LKDVLFFQLENGRKTLDVRAPRARVEKRETSVRLTFFEGRALQWVSLGPAEEESGGDEKDRSEEESDEPRGFWQAGMTGDLVVEVELPPEGSMRQFIPDLRHMTWRQLREERRELRRLGILETTPLDMHIQQQVAFSFASFGFVLVGIPLGVRSHRRETSAGVAAAIGLVLVYYMFLIIAQAVETRPEAAPWLIVWLPNALFQLTGAWLLWRVNRGR
jgi:lipopolysaccharide export system permease protein